MKVRILFYKYKWKWVNFAIQAWTWLFNWWTKSYSHCEVWTPDDNPNNVSCDKFKSTIPQGNPQFADCTPPLKQEIAGTCWTSTMRGDYNGTVKRPASEVLTHPERWDYYEIELGEVWYEGLVEFMEQACKKNKGYDKPALWKFFLPFGKWRRSTPDKYICSEFVQSSLYTVCIFDKQHLWSPRRLSKKLDKLGYEAKEL